MLPHFIKELILFSLTRPYAVGYSTSISHLDIFKSSVPKLKLKFSRLRVNIIRNGKKSSLLYLLLGASSSSESALSLSTLPNSRTKYRLLTLPSGE